MNKSATDVFNAPQSDLSDRAINSVALKIARDFILEAADALEDESVVVSSVKGREFIYIDAAFAGENVRISSQDNGMTVRSLKNEPVSDQNHPIYFVCNKQLVQVFDCIAEMFAAQNTDKIECLETLYRKYRNDAAEHKPVNQIEAAL